VAPLLALHNASNAGFEAYPQPPRIEIFNINQLLKRICRNDINRTIRSTHPDDAAIPTHQIPT
jgi:hypothetical protein